MAHVDHNNPWGVGCSAADPQDCDGEHGDVQVDDDDSDPMTDVPTRADCPTTAIPMKSTKSLSSLASSLSLASLRTRTASTPKYLVRSASGGGGGCVVVRSRRNSTSSVTASSSSRGGASSHAGRDERRMLRTTSGGATSPPPAFFDPSVAGSRPFHNSAYNPPPSSSVPSSSHSASTSDVPSYSPKNAQPSSESSLLIAHQTTPTGPSLSSDPQPSTSSSSDKSTQSNPPTSDRATLFTSHTSASYPSHTLPAFFGTTLNTARRSNLVFRNGAYGIPKASVGDENYRLSKGKEKVVERETNEPEHELSVGIGEDAVSLSLSSSLDMYRTDEGWS